MYCFLVQSDMDICIKQKFTENYDLAPVACTDCDHAAKDFDTEAGDTKGKKNTVFTTFYIWILW